MSVNICMITFETRTWTQRHFTLFAPIIRSLPIALYCLCLDFIIIILFYSQRVCCGHYSTHSLIGHLSVNCQGLEVFLRGNVDLSFCGTYDTRFFLEGGPCNHLSCFISILFCHIFDKSQPELS